MSKMNESKSGDSSLRDWFGKSKSSDGKPGWVQLGGKYAGKPCARQPGQKTKPKCGSSKMKRNLNKKEEDAAFRRKQRQDPNPDRKGKAINVKTESYVAGKPAEKLDAVTAIPKKERLEVAITCNAASGSGRLVAYIGLDDETRSISGVWHQAFEGKQGQTRGKLTGTATDSKTLAMLLNTYGKDRASVVFNQISENQLNIKIREVGADNRATFDVSFKR